MTDAQSDPPLSLLSLSLAAAASKPLPQHHDQTSLSPTDSVSTTGRTVIHGANGNGIVSGTRKPRRLSSASSSRRRLSDAREAGLRVSQSQGVAGLSTAAAALSLSSSPPPDSQLIHHSTQSPSIAVSPTQQLAVSLPITTFAFQPKPLLPNYRVRTLPTGYQTLNGTPSVGALESLPPPTSAIIGSKKKGTIFRCESCSKVYRHPSCLVKHRWEHSPHWKEANKFLLSKHQQVQLLEAAAILSHITPISTRGSGGPATSLPDDRSLWPSYLSAYVPPTPEDTIKDDDGNDDDDDPDVEDVAIEEDIGHPHEENDESGDFEMDLEDMEPSGPISSSVPSSSLLTTPFARLSANSRTGEYEHGVSSHRTRSRSRSVSKSIHKNVLMMLRGMPPKGSASGRAAEKEKDDAIPAGVERAANGTGVGVTLRPGLIAVPASNSLVTGTGNIHGQASVNSNLSPKLEDKADAWTPHHLGRSSFPHSPSSWSPPESISASTSPISLTRTQVTPYISSSIRSTGFSASTGPESLSLPRSSLRSSSSFIETDEPSSLEEDQDDQSPELWSKIREGSSGSECRELETDKRNDASPDEQWDGEEMELEMGY